MVDEPDYRGFRMTELHAITGIDDDDEEGIPALMAPDGGAMPLIASDRVRLEKLVEIAQSIADRTGKNFKIVKFSVREEIGEIKSKKLS